MKSQPITAADNPTEERLESKKTEAAEVAAAKKKKKKTVGQTLYPEVEK